MGDFDAFIKQGEPKTEGGFDDFMKASQSPQPGGFDSFVRQSAAAAPERRSQNRSGQITGGEIDGLLNGEHGNKIRSFFGTIKKFEGGQPDLIVGGQKRFDPNGDHPNIVGLRTAQGASTAAGDYQITGSNWYKNGLKRRLGAKNFSPENQLRAAVMMFTDRDNRAGLNALLSGDYQAAEKVAAKDWAALPSSQLHPKKFDSKKYNEFFHQLNAGYTPSNSIQAHSYLPEVEDVPQVEINVGDVVPSQYPTENGLRPADAPPPITQDWTPFPETPTEKGQRYLDDAERDIAALPTNPNDTINAGNSSLSQRPLSDVEQFQPPAEQEQSDIGALTDPERRIGETSFAGDVSAQTTPKTKTAKHSPSFDFASGYKDYLHYTQKTDSQSERANYKRLVATNPNLHAVIDAQIDAPQGENQAAPEANTQEKPDVNATDGAKVDAPQNAQKYAPMLPDTVEASFKPVSLQTEFKKRPTVDDIIYNGTIAAYGESYPKAKQVYETLTGEKLNNFDADRESMQKHIDNDYDEKTGKISLVNFTPLDRQKAIVDAFNRKGEQGIKDLLGQQSATKEQAQFEIEQSAKQKELLDRQQTIKEQESALREQAIAGLNSDRETSANFVTPEFEIGEDGRLREKARRELTESEIQAEMENLRAAMPSAAQLKEAGELAKSDEDSGLLGLAFGALGNRSAEFLLNKGAAVLRPLSAMLGGSVTDAYRGTQRLSNTYSEAEKPTDAAKETYGQKVARFAGGTTADLLGLSIEMGIAKRIPMLRGREAVAVFAADATATSIGKGESIPTAAGRGLKGAIQGKIFEASSQVSNYVFGKSFAKSGDVLSPGFADALKMISPAQINAVKEGIKSVPPALRGAYIRAQILGTGAEIGVIGAGTAANAKAFGATDDEALHEAASMVLFHLGNKYGGSAVDGIKKLSGKIFRIWENGRSGDFSVNPDGALVRYNKPIPKEFVDGEIISDPNNKIYETEVGADGVYRAKGETANRATQTAQTARVDDFDANQPGNVPNNKPERAGETVSNNGSRLNEGIAPRELEAQNPPRIESPHPEAVREVEKSTHAQKISEILADGQAHTIESLQKQTRFSRENVEAASMSLYGARRVEMLPDGSIRRIETPSAEIEKPRTIAERAAERYQPQGEPIALGESSLPIEQKTAPVDDAPAAQSTFKSPVPKAEMPIEDAAAKAYENLPQQRQQETAPEKPIAQVKFAERPNVAEKLNVFTERGTKASIEPKVVESTDLLTSLDKGYPQEFQPRDRSRAASKAQISEIAGKLKPEFLGDSPKASDGRPLVVPVSMPDGATKYAVISGNGRTAGIREAYNLENEGANSYAEFAKGKDSSANHKQPVYVGVLDPNEIKDLSEFAKEANESATAQMSATEQAKSDAERLDADVLNLFVPSDDGTIHSTANRDFTRAFMERAVSTGEQGRLVDADGKLNQDGITRVRNAVFASAFGESEAGLSAITRMSESTDNNVKNITNGLLAKAGALATLKQAAKTGTRYKDFDVASDFAKAMEKYAGLKDAGTSVDEYIQQGNLFGAETTPFQTRVMQVFDTHRRSSKAIRGIIDNYLSVVEDLGNPNQRNLFGEKEKPSVESVFEGAVKIYEKSIAAAGDVEQIGLFNENQRRENQSAARQPSDGNASEISQSEEERTEESRQNRLETKSPYSKPENPSGNDSGLYKKSKNQSALYKRLETLDENEDSVEDLLKSAKIRLTEDGQMLTNPEAHELFKRALKIAFYDHDLEMVYGSYLSPQSVELVRDALRFGVLGGRMDFSNKQKTKALLKQFEDSVNLEYGDIVQISTSEDVPDGLPEAVAEEKAHRADYRIGLSHTVGKEVVQASADGRAAMRKLQSGAYKGANDITAAVEVIAKLFVDGNDELGLTDERNDQLAEKYVIGLLDNGVRAEDIEREFSSLGKRGKKYADRAKQIELQRNSGSNEPLETSRTTSIPIDFQGNRKIRQRSGSVSNENSKGDAGDAGSGFLDETRSGNEQVSLAKANGLTAKILSFVQKARSIVGDVPGDYLELGTVTPETAEKIRQLTGVDVAGFTHALDISGIKHTFNEHGDPLKEEPRGQSAIIDDDFALIPEIVKNPDTVTKGKLTKKKGLQAIEYTKIFNGKIYYVETIREGKRRLVIQSMRKSKKQLATPPVPTSKNDASTESKGVNADVANNEDYTTKNTNEITKSTKLKDAAKIEILYARAPLNQQNLNILQKGLSKVWEGRDAESTPVKEVITNFRRAGLLTAPKTHLKNMASNTLMQAGEEATRPLAILADIAASAFTGSRTVQNVSMPALMKSFAALVRQDATMKALDMESARSRAWNILKNGDVKELGKNQLQEMQSGSPILDAFVNYTFRALGAEDALFKTYAMRRSLEESAGTLAITEHRADRSVNVKQRRDELLKSPTNEMLLEAELFADFTTFTNANPLSDTLTKFKEVNSYAKFAIETIVPYDKTPTNIIARVLEYSPLGLGWAGKHLYDLKKGESYTFAKMRQARMRDQKGLDANRSGARLRANEWFNEKINSATTPAEKARLKARFDILKKKRNLKDVDRQIERDEIQDAMDKLFPRIAQQQFARSVGRFGLGTAALGLGIYLAMEGLLSGIWDAGERGEMKEFYDRKDLGILNASLQIGGRRYGIGDTPLGKVMAIGASIYERSQKPLDDGKTRASQTVGDVYDVGKMTVMEQPLLNSLDDYFGSNKSAEKRIGGLLGSFVPGIAASLADVLDDEARSNDRWYSGINRIPKLREESEKAKNEREPYMQNTTNRIIDKFDPFNSRPVTAPLPTGSIETRIQTEMDNLTNATSDKEIEKIGKKLKALVNLKKAEAEKEILGKSKAQYRKELKEEIK